MTPYSGLAHWYDALTNDVPYNAFLDFYEDIFHSYGKPGTVLDLACGTGTLSCMLAQRGYEMISVDISADMLAVARDKADSLRDCIMPLFLCQDIRELDLYGTVDAAICSLDSLNYIETADIPEVFRRLALFVAPGGVLIFDVFAPERLCSRDGEVFVDESVGVFCVWRAEFDKEFQRLLYGIDIFTQSGGYWDRGFEEHIEYAHDLDVLENQLQNAGFTDIRRYTDGPDAVNGRIHFTSIRKG